MLLLLLLLSSSSLLLHSIILLLLPSVLSLTRRPGLCTNWIDSLCARIRAANNVVEQRNVWIRVPAPAAPAPAFGAGPPLAFPSRPTSARARAHGWCIGPPPPKVEKDDKPAKVLKPAAKKPITAPPTPVLAAPPPIPFTITTSDAGDEGAAPSEPPTKIFESLAVVDPSRALLAPKPAAAPKDEGAAAAAAAAKEKEKEAAKEAAKETAKPKEPEPVREKTMVASPCCCVQVLLIAISCVVVALLCAL